MTVGLDERDVSVALAKRQLFVVAVLAAMTPRQLDLVRELRDSVACALTVAGDRDQLVPPLQGGSSAPPSSPLPLIEYGVTVRRERGKA